jgi:outer membrane protein assembly factor BamB
MQSSIERFDADTLAHVGSQPLAGAPGSATWVDRAGTRWLVAFAHYAGRGGEPGRGPEHSRILAYDTDWRRVASYRYPDGLIARFAGYSNSGGAVAAGGVLYLTGHDARELYVACLRATDGSVLWHSTWPAPFAGQGIAWDAGSGTLWAIERRAREVLQLEIPEKQKPARYRCAAGQLP